MHEMIVKTKNKHIRAKRNILSLKSSNILKNYEGNVLVWQLQKSIDEVNWRYVYVLLITILKLLKWVHHSHNWIFWQLFIFVYNVTAYIRYPFTLISLVFLIFLYFSPASCIRLIEINVMLVWSLVPTSSVGASAWHSLPFFHVRHVFFIWVSRVL